jgi:hypothetical protein|tara:strand:+ start:77 stop:1123 length:1047 start_codon:yes stop_codon:yes gene_type:complete
MSYIGKTTDGFGVRDRFIYVVSSGATSVSGADANGATLKFTDGAYVDVYLNGVLLKAGTDYNTNTANTIAGIASMSANDEVTVIVYDVFTVADTVSAASGGTFNGNITISSTDSGSSEDPDLILHRNSASPADNDQLGQLVFRGRNDNSEDVEYARIRSQSTDVSNGTEDGKLNINVMNNGSMQGRMDFRGGQPTRFFNADVEIGDGDLYFKDSGKGIVLGATSNIDANTLDDYEEGTFTAAFTNFSGSATFSNAVYTKIGQMVFYTLHITGKSNTSDGDQMTVSGFPFAVLGEHPAAVGMNDNEFGHAMVNTAELLYFYNLTGGPFTYDMFPHTSGYARIQGAYRIA